MEAQPIALRVDGTDSSQLLSVLSADGGAYLVVKEYTDGNPHFHAVLHSVRKLSAVRQALKRALPNGGNGAYSVTQVRDLAKYQRYMMKGDSADVMPNVVSANGWCYQDPSWQEEQHDAYWEENQQLQNKRKRAPVHDVVLQRCKELKYAWHDRERIAQVYIRELSQRGKGINIFAVKSQVCLIQVELCPDDTAVEELARQI